MISGFPEPSKTQHSTGYWLKLALREDTVIGQTNTWDFVYGFLKINITLLQLRFLEVEDGLYA